MDELIDKGSIFTVITADICKKYRKRIMQLSINSPFSVGLLSMHYIPQILIVTSVLYIYISAFLMSLCQLCFRKMKKKIARKPFDYHIS